MTDDVAVNVHHGRSLLEPHLVGRVHVSVEADVALGTAGALGRARDWIDGRAVVVVNGDAWTTASLAPAARRVGRRAAPRARRRAPRRGVAAACASPAPCCRGRRWRGLRPEPSGLWETAWRDADVEAVAVEPGTPFVDCGTPAAYLAANLAASGGAPVVGAGAVVEGELVRSVVWSGRLRAPWRAARRRHPRRRPPHRRRATVTSCSARSCPQAASMSTPARAAHGDVHAERRQQVAEGPHPRGRRALHRVAGRGVQRDEVHVRRQRQRPAQPGEALGVDVAVVDAVDERPLERQAAALGGEVRRGRRRAGRAAGSGG